jgi:hypothetical protein
MNSEVDPKSTRAYRRARLAVVILTTLLVLGVVALVVGFVRQARLMMQSHAVRTTLSEGAAAMVTLAPGARILSAGTDAGKLVLHVATPAGSEVDIIDLATGRLTAQVKTAPAK